jgi:hypothetical protein
MTTKPKPVVRTRKTEQEDLSLILVVFKGNMSIVSSAEARLVKRALRSALIVLTDAVNGKDST